MPPPLEHFRPGNPVHETNPMPVRLVSTQATAVDATQPLGYKQITSAELKSVCHLDPPAGSLKAVVQNNGGSTVRYREDGEDPSSMHGMRIRVDDQAVFVGDLSLPAFLDEGDNAVLDVSYYG